MRRRMIVLLVVVSLVWLVGCAGIGKQSHPMERLTSKDDTLTCDELRREIDYLDSHKQYLEKSRSKRHSENAAWFIGGMILFAPMLAGMDLTDTESVEIKACDDRLDVLCGHQKVRCPEDAVKRAELVAIRKSKEKEVKDREVRFEENAKDQK